MNNMYLLEIEFRYRHVKEYEYDSGHRFKTIVIGIYDTRNEAVNAGDKTLEMLSQHFEVRPDDKFGNKNLVSNFGYPTKGVTYFLSIRELNLADLTDVVKEVFEENGKAIADGK